MVNEQPILIVGAGAAGISAAVRLIFSGLQNIIILEAKDRIGGRVHTVDFGDNFVELGAQWVHGEKKNVVFEFASPHNLLGSSIYHNDYTKYIFVTPKGIIMPQEESTRILNIYHDIAENMYDESNSLDGSYGEYFSKEYFKRIEEDPFVDRAKAEQYLEWLHKIEKSINAVDSWDDLSAKRLQDYWNCDGDLYLNWKDNGYKTLFDILMRKIPDKSKVPPIMEKVQLNKEVCSIDYNSSNEVSVTTTDGTKYKASHVIFTTSLGVLKEKHSSLFTPSLPLTKQHAIENLNVGTVNKIFLEFPHRWWPADTSGFSIIWPKEDKSEFLETHGQDKEWLCDVYKFFTVDYQPRVLTAWVSGPNARYVESLSDSEVLDSLQILLETTLGRNYNITKPDKMLRSRWFSDEHFRGSYSFQSLTTEKSNVSTRDLSAPILSDDGKPLLLFAGESTHEHYYSTVHGAVETGFREADRLINYYRKQASLGRSTLKRPIERNEKRIRTRMRTTIVIVGAGIAGLAAAKCLEDENFEDYLLIEAQDHTGGRINSIKWDKGWIECGAQFLHGDNSELADICNRYQLLSNVQFRDGDGTFFRENGRKVEEVLIRDVDDFIRDTLEECEDYDKAWTFYRKFENVGKFLRHRLDEHLQKTGTMSMNAEVKKEIFDWNVRFLTIDNSISTLDKLSIKNWGKFKYVGGSEHLSFNSGYSSVVKCISKGLNQKNLLLNKAVILIEWQERLEKNRNTKSLIVTLSDGTKIDADCAIVTCPLGYLKDHHKRMFNPPLPPNLTKAIENLGFGLINKIFLDFEKPWWEPNVKGFQFLWSSKESVGSRRIAAWTRSLTGFDILQHHKAVLLGWVGGQSAYDIETLTEKQILADCHDLLRYFLKNDAIPPAKRCKRTQWYTNEYIKGSYSHISTSCDEEDISPSSLATPIWGKIIDGKCVKDVPLIMFAGEATHDSCYSTTHGAYDTGVKQARRCLSHHVQIV